MALFNRSLVKSEKEKLLMWEKNRWVDIGEQLPVNYLEISLDDEAHHNT